MTEGRALQRRYALARAEQMRLYRAWLVEMVASGEMTLEGLFREQECGAGCDEVRIVVLAERVPGVGKVRARRSMLAAGIPDDARWGEVSAPTLRRLWSAMAEAALIPL